MTSLFIICLQLYCLLSVACGEQESFEKIFQIDSEAEIANVNATERDILTHIKVNYTSCHEGESIPWADTVLLHAVLTESCSVYRLTLNVCLSL